MGGGYQCYQLMNESQPDGPADRPINQPIHMNVYQPTNSERAARGRLPKQRRRRRGGVRRRSPRVRRTEPPEGDFEYSAADAAAAYGAVVPAFVTLAAWARAVEANDALARLRRGRAEEDAAAAALAARKPRRRVPRGFPPTL